MKFDEFDLDPAVLDGIDSMNFDEATPIQALTIPPLLQGRDLLGVAQTGTGKTAAYLLPIINRIYEGEFLGNELKAVVVVPTRELAQQIDRQIQGFGYFVSISSIAIYGGTGGVAWEQQKRSIQSGADIIVATPGRLIDLLNNNAASIDTAKYLVIDEADRMLDMGFYEDIIAIRNQLPEDCQIALFSATMPEKIAGFANKLLKNPAKVEIAVSKPPESITQCAYVCYEPQKLPIIASLFASKEKVVKRTVIFASSKKKVRELTSKLHELKINVGEMHSDLDQTQRDQVMRDFKVGYIEILVATDIVARGIDIDDIEVVVNYDMPHDPEDYVHRIGRTARGIAGSGIAITLVTDKDRRDFDNLQRFLGKAIHTLPMDSSIGEAPYYEYDTEKRANPKGEGQGNGQGRRGSGKRFFGKKGNRPEKSSN